MMEERGRPGGGGGRSAKSDAQAKTEAHTVLLRASSNVDPGVINSSLLIWGCSPPEVNIIPTETRDTPY